jgi:hypothetical protein
MTLVVALAVSGQPVLIGDLLISSSAPPDDITLPNFGQVKPVRDGRSAPAGMRQKLAVISRHLAIGWSGGEVAAYRVLSKVHAEYSNGKYVTPAGIFDFLDSLDGRDLRELALIGMAYDGKTLHRFRHGAVEFDHPMYGRVMAMGSGLEHFQAHMSQMGDKFESRGTLNPVATAISTTLSYTAALLIDELLTTRNLDHGYGAGFEFICPVGAEDGAFALEKLPSLTTLFWQVAPDRRRVVPVRLLFKQRYHNDILLITRIAKDTFQNGAKILKDEVLTHVVTPIYRAADSDGLENYWRTLPQLDSAYLLNYILDQTIEGKPRILMLIKSGPKPVTFNVRELDFEMEWKQDFAEEMLYFANRNRS